MCIGMQSSLIRTDAARRRGQGRRRESNCRFTGKLRWVPLVVRREFRHLLREQELIDLNSCFIQDFSLRFHSRLTGIEKVRSMEFASKPVYDEPARGPRLSG